MLIVSLTTCLFSSEQGPPPGREFFADLAYRNEGGMEDYGILLQNLVNYVCFNKAKSFSFLALSKKNLCI